MDTARLRLRGWTAADLEPFARLNADPEVMRHFPATLSRGESDALARRVAAHLEEHGWGLWVVDVLDGPITGFAGFTGLARADFDAPFTPAVEVGWRLGRRFWGNGYATEAACAALDHGFQELRLDEVVSFTAVENERSQAVMRRLGMHHHERDDFEHPNVPPGHRLRPHVLYRITREEWHGGPRSAATSSGR